MPPNILLTIKCKNLLQEMLEKDPIKRITISDIEDHPWVNISMASLSLAEENHNCKTTGSCDEMVNLDSTERVYNGIFLNEYDEEDLKRMSKVELIRIKTKRNFYKSKKTKERKNTKDGSDKNCPQKKSGHVLN
jgi:serine/threonine protein kinase